MQLQSIARGLCHLLTAGHLDNRQLTCDAVGVPVERFNLYVFFLSLFSFTLYLSAYPAMCPQIDSSVGRETCGPSVKRLTSPNSGGIARRWRC